MLEHGHYRTQFKQLAWTWMALVLIVTQSAFVAANTLDGLFWYFIASKRNYIFSFFFSFLLLLLNCLMLVFLSLFFYFLSVLAVILAFSH